MKARDARAALKQFARVERAVVSQRFFKTGAGQYGEGDVFIGVNMPDTRKVARRFKNLELSEVQKLINSDIHEERMCGLVILVCAYEKAEELQQKEIYEMYLRNVYAGRVNNWDLVDVTTPRIVGEYLADKPKDILYELAHSDNLWQKRVAVLAVFAFIKRGETKDAVMIAEILLRDTHDLIHKAVGWMLRELGKRAGEEYLRSFLDKHAHVMPRTMLRYAIERLSPEQKLRYMGMK